MDFEDIDEEIVDNKSEIQPKIVFQDKVTNSDHKISEEELHSLYLSFDIDINEINRKYSLWRLQVIHIRGVHDMSSEDILKYFQDFEPNSIEWVNDLSCNVVFSDQKAAAIAMKVLTTALVVKMSKYSVNNDLDIEVIDADSLSVPIPPQFRWRLGKSVNKSKALLLRFATNKDKKVSGSRPLSQYYTKYGVPNDIVDTTPTPIPNRKRRFKWNEREERVENRKDSAYDLRTKRFRMRADEEQQLILNRKTAKMRITEEDTRSHRKSIWERLDNDSSGKFCAVDTDLLEIAFDNKTNSRKTVWKESSLRSTLAISRSNKNASFDRSDLRTKLRQNSF